MNDNQNHLDVLLAKLESLSQRQALFSKEIAELQQEIIRLKSAEVKPSQAEITATVPPIAETAKSEVIVQSMASSEATVKKEMHPRPSQASTSQPIPKKKRKGKSDIEKFIGENLINKIGIIILIIGVSIGVKYSIDNDLISPLTRIILGFVAGLGLLGIGLKLKKNYLNYSAVLVSGAMAIMYFTTFSAYDFYALIPQTAAFGLMFLFTAFTVIAALNYDKQIIAHLGLVGAYAVPFLLSDGSGNAAVLFSYMAIINIGVLIIAFTKYWKPVYYVSFALTWLIYASWFIMQYDTETQFTIAFAFATVFFIIFYVTFLAYKLKRKEAFAATDVILVSLNSFIYYGFGYAILNDHETGIQLLGVFTLANAVIHFIVSAIIFRKKQTHKSLLYLIAIMVLTFITIAIPVQLDGNWVSLLWVAEAALLFWVGRTKELPAFEKVSYVLMTLAMLSLMHDWYEVYLAHYFNYLDEIEPMQFFVNIAFASSMIFVLAFAFINYIDHKTKATAALSKKNVLRMLFSFFMPAMLIFALYMAVRLEIEYYFKYMYHASMIETNLNGANYPTTSYDQDIMTYKSVWILNFTLLFFSLLGLVNLKKIKNNILGYITLGLTITAVLVFLGQGLYAISELRESYIDQEGADLYIRSNFNMIIRYISLAFLALAIYVSHLFIKKHITNLGLKVTFSMMLQIALIWVLSSELLSWMDLGGSKQQYKLGLSILWGVYSLLMIVIGIWKNKQYLRIAAIVLFALTLIKLFFYDLTYLNTLSKTIVFVALGILLLLISFLYNKFKIKISKGNEDTE